MLVVPTYCGKATTASRSAVWSDGACTLSNQKGNSLETKEVLGNQIMSLFMCVYMCEYMYMPMYMCVNESFIYFTHILYTNIHGKTEGT